DVRVVDIRHFGDVHHSVGYVHPVDIHAAHAISGHKDFAWRQGKPAHARSTAKAPLVANEHHESRRVDWPHDNRPRNPAPSIFDVGPPAVVEGGKSPRFVVDPSPTPRTNPDPMPVTIRSPAHRSGSRNPDRTVIRNVAPATVIVQVLVAGHLLRNVLRSVGAVFATVAIECPIIEISRMRD